MHCKREWIEKRFLLHGTSSRHHSSIRTRMHPSRCHHRRHHHCPCPFVQYYHSWNVSFVSSPEDDCGDAAQCLVRLLPNPCFECDTKMQKSQSKVVLVATRWMAILADVVYYCGTVVVVVLAYVPRYCAGSWTGTPNDAVDTSPRRRGSAPKRKRDKAALADGFLRCHWFHHRCHDPTPQQLLLVPAADW